MYWNKLKQIHYHKNPVEHIHVAELFPTKEYDKLYENQNNLSHQLWQDVRDKFKINFVYHTDINKTDLTRDVIALWFFRDRNDHFKKVDIELAGKQLTYYPNTFLLTKSKKFKFNERTKKSFARPVIQLGLNTIQFENITNGFKK
jgi:hypothetical protein